MLLATPTHPDALSGNWKATICLARRSWSQVPALRDRDLRHMLQRTTPSQTLSHFDQIRYCSTMDEWTPMFAVRKEFSLAMANKPHIETLEEYLRECEDQATEESDIPDEEEANEGRVPRSTRMRTQFASSCASATRAKFAYLRPIRWLSSARAAPMRPSMQSDWVTSGSRAKTVHARTL